MNRLIFLFMVLFACHAQASDLKKEQRWADQVIETILDGEEVWLNDGANDFLGIYTEAEEDNNRAVIVMHGTGIHPDWQQVVQPLRVGLTEHNWNTLSIQMPVLANEAEYHEYAPLYDEVPPRIDAAIKLLHEKGSKSIVLIGHSQGSAMAAYYLASSKEPTIKGFVAIGMATLSSDPRMNSIEKLKKIRIPVLDLYGTDDLQEIKDSAGLRVAAASKAGNKNYTQTKITGNHFFDDEEDNLTKTVADWLDRLKLN